MPLTLTVTPGNLTGTFTVAGSSASGTIKGAKLTGDCVLAWSNVGTFLADGSQSIAMARGPWVFVALSGSDLSNPEHVYVRDEDDNIHAAIFDAVHARLLSLAIPGIEGRVLKRSVLENVAGSWPACLVDIPNNVGETAGQAGGTNERSDWGYPVRVTFGDRVLSKLDPDAAIVPTLERRRIAFAAFDRKRLSAHPDVFDTRVEPGAVRQNYATDSGAGYHIIGSTFTVRAVARVRRGF